MLYLITIALIFILYFKDKNKTINGVKKGIKKLKKNLPAFLNMMILVALSLHFVSKDLIVEYLGAGSGLTGLSLAGFFGSITLMPGFIAFPLSGILLERGVSYTVIAVFTTTLMLVGILTYPVEKEYFGVKVTIIRNVISLVIALIVSLLVGIFYGEVGLIS
ncbi:hypothetical protein [Halanaerobacter jeridensis]|uniref:Uncharacterized membrane protein YraQ (UPF0718 family) n=1 Tax=Halanaerobacter jeridensis TaxID=706427 RepID=A0A938XUD1_9FIRM|nr:hypothetical protein [Halanaerobacter jeridensis]MBM7555737.1 uncharacterized membrane protein YraQ (UPF0718 family) [Halanaerobacter jeridensis]